MKIGIDISQVVYKGTGVASYTENLVKAMLRQKGHEFVLFGTSFGRQKELWSFIHSLPTDSSFRAKTFSLPISFISFLWNQLHIGRIERLTGNLDIFHTSDWTEPPSKIPKVTTIHDLMIYKFPEHLPEEIIETQRRKLAWVSRESKLIIADSKSTKSDIVRFLNIPAEKIHVIYLGVDDAYFPQSRDRVTTVLHKYRIRQPYFLCVGTREPRKNLQRVLTAFSSFKQANRTLVIAGNFGWGEDVAIIPGVKILGFVPKKDLPALYTGATAFVYPSLYEGFGLPVLESLSCGTPVVTSKRGSLGEIAEGVAIEVNPESSADIRRGLESIILLTPAKRKALVQKGLQHTAQFTWENTARNTIEVYKKIVSL
ncbi:TPA: hypothetical protein DIV55_01995 [Patescibacteria group bacterium]|uniref:Glycosyl transferase group 1 n=1 Tax=Candidatus Gottesmanbacteria bacterium GW2011_GWA1_43_11 TaxID=1618436 RepID=A0A0G1CLB1_9BACT|nr:MAG: Glycosyl transferase group 1 [Candidatus Gottesmanbacteria bacterium GW2011_GWA1_43_11]HCS78495.1 hypothetical protein [Patescibacteria group bacterium]